MQSTKIPGNILSVIALKSIIKSGGIFMFKLADYLILTAVFVSFLFSIYLWFMVDKSAGIFVGLWVPSILGIGIYFKLSSNGK